MSDTFKKDFLDWLATRLEKDAEATQESTHSSPLIDSFRQAMQSHQNQEWMQAVYGYQQVLRFGDPIKDRHFIAIALNNLAWIFLKNKTLADIEEALQLALKANQLRDETDPETLDTLAECYYRKGEFEKALHFLKKAIECCDDLQYKENYLFRRETAFQKHLNPKE